MRWSGTSLPNNKYWHEGEAVFLVLFAYCKNVQDDLTQAQLKVLRRIVREEFE